MKKQIMSLLLPAALSILAIFIVFAINQTAGIVDITTRVNPIFGNFVLYLLLIVFGTIVSVPFVIFFKMPSALIPPEDETSKEYEQFLKKRIKRLSKNVHLKELGIFVETREDIENGVQVLNEIADDLIKKNASLVFLTTGVSQNGRLDALMVLAAQTRMVWQVASIYNQRPSIRELSYLYANVAATVFLASEIEDLDITEQVEPVITSVLGGAVTGAIPGVNIVANIVTNSIMEGAANAFLTLRVGIITKRYFGSMTKVNRRNLRRAASFEAAPMLGAIVVKSAGAISEAIWKAAKKSASNIPQAMKDASKKSTEFVMDTSIKSAEVIGSASKKSAKTVIKSMKKIFSGKENHSE